MWKGIRLRVLLLTLMPVIAVSMLLGFYSINNAIKYLKSYQQTRAINIITTLAAKSELLVFTQNKNTLFNLIENKLNNEIVGIAFYNDKKEELSKIGRINTNKTILASYPIAPSIISTYNITSVSIPITAPITTSNIYPYLSNEIKQKISKNPAIIGWVALELDNSTLHIEQYKMLFNSSIIILIGLVISYLLAYKISAKIINPILSITTAVEKIKLGDLNIHIQTNASWELAVLESGINTMTSSLQTAHGELQHNIEQATADLRHTLETIEIQNIELEISRKEAENASKVKSEFLASMSHELRTPLNGIIGFINLLLKTDLNTRQSDYLVTIQKSANALLSIINDILDFSKIEAGKLCLDLEPMDIRECIEDALTLLAPCAHEKSIELIPFFYSDVPETILGDPLRIKQVLTNLVNNSIKFTEQGSVIVRVMLDKELPNNKVTLCVSVEDTGKGLTEEQQKELFHSFNQLDPKITKKFGGTGLGLVICKRLIEQMHGKINLESAPNKGSTFWFTIEVEKSINNTNENIVYDKLKDIRVLLFEKHPITNLAITHVLKNWGMIVQQVSKLEDVPLLISQAYEFKNPFQLTLIGINQLDHDKPLIERIINSNQEHYLCPIGILVNTTDHLLHNKSLVTGVTLSLAKPICREKLYKALCNIFTSTSHQHMQNITLTEQLNILAVDDNIANLKLIAALLENIGTTVTTATNGKEALQHIKQKKFSLILMDINMPDMDGLETAQAIRQMSSDNKDVPIVALSAHIALDRKTNMQDFIDDYLSKPVNENQLKATIYKWTQPGIIKNVSVSSEGSPLSDTNNALTLDEYDKYKELTSIDWSLGKKLAADNLELAKELFAMLIRDLPKEQKAINDAYQKFNIKDLGHYVHKLHGGCCYIGVPKLKFLAKTLEKAVINTEENKIKTLLDELNKEINVLINVDIDEIELSSL